MPLILNIHTPAHSYALPYRKDEPSSSLIDRIVRKSGLDKKAASGVKEGREGGSLQYEFEGGRWTLQDDDDLEIMLSRYPPNETSSITLHLTPPKNAQLPAGSDRSNALYSSPPREKRPNGILNPSSTSKPSDKVGKKGKSAGEKGEAAVDAGGHVTTLLPEKPVHDSPSRHNRFVSNGSASKSTNGTQANPPPPGDFYVPSAPKSQAQTNNPDLLIPRAPRSFAPSTFSTRTTLTSRPKSVHPTTGAIRGYEDDGEIVEGETLGDRHKRKWKAFHEGRGVRTVVGSIGGVKDVRMLIKLGYRHVYVSRPFATRSGLIPKNSAMGTYGYAGLVNLGQLPITVGSKTEKHTVMISEESNFDVVLGRSWMEKMGIKTDPLDQTHLSYYDTNEVIPCDIVVLKDSTGQVITVT